MTDYTAKDIERFWSKVDKREQDECWNWKLTPMKQGYGRLQIKRKFAYSHRMSYELAYGEIQNGLWVLHKCDNRLCCNPHHLFLGTMQDNGKDMVEKNRHAKGEQSGMHKLSSHDVLAIRQLYVQGVKPKILATQFGTSQQHIHRIVKYKARVSS